MSLPAKIALSAPELELVCNKEWILTKQIIIEKVYGLFGVLALSMEEKVSQYAAKLQYQATASLKYPGVRITATFPM
ncbi:MAG: hypothetical protein WKI04_04975 [Ferruginibacter sp.]